MTKYILDEASNLSALEKMQEFDAGRRKENVKACGDQKLFLYQQICHDHSLANALYQIETEMLNRGLISQRTGAPSSKATTNVINSNQNAKSLLAAKAEAGGLGINDFHPVDLLFMLDHKGAASKNVIKSEMTDDEKLVQLIAYFLLAKVAKLTDEAAELENAIFSLPNAGSKADLLQLLTATLSDQAVINRIKHVVTEVMNKNESLEINNPCNEDIEKHDELNTKLWSNEKLKPEVKTKIEEIVDEFVTGLAEDDINIDVRDIVIIGSNCSYNYNKDSDLDIHIVTDSADIQTNKLYSAYRSLFNKKFEIDFFGIPVEIFVDTENTSTVSNGIYSVMNDSWIKEPVLEEIPEIDEEAFEDELKVWEDRYNKIMDNKKLTEASHDMYAKPEGNRKAAYNNALKYAKQYNKDFIYGYTDRSGKFFALEQPIKCTGEVWDEEAKFRAKYKNCNAVYVAYKDKNFIESLKESQAQEIGDIYRHLSKLYNVNFDKLVYGDTGFMEVCYPNGFPDFNGDVIYSKKYWDELMDWGMKTGKLDADLVNQYNKQTSIDEMLYNLNTNGIAECEVIVNDTNRRFKTLPGGDIGLYGIVDRRGLWKNFVDDLECDKEDIKVTYLMNDGKYDHFKVVYTDSTVALHEDAEAAKSIVSDQLRGEWDAVKNYEAAIAELDQTDGSFDNIIDILNSIADEEETHIGELETAKALISDDTLKNIENGKTEASQQDFPVDEGLTEKVKTPKLDEINKYIEDIYQLRKDGLAKDGEYGIGNLVFKELRNKGCLDNLKAMKNELIGNELSIKEAAINNSKIKQVIDYEKNDNCLEETANSWYLTNEDRIKYKDLLWRLTRQQPIVQQNGRFDFYNVNESDVNRLISLLNSVDYVEYVQKTAGKFDFNKFNYNGLVSRKYNVYGKIKF